MEIVFLVNVIYLQKLCVYGESCFVRSLASVFHLC